VLAVLAACGPRRLTLPTDPGTPLPDFAQVHAQASAACAGVRTMTAELGLSGRAGGQRIPRVRLVAGFERPASMRLEAIGAFGRRVFTLVARDGSATLFLESESRILRDAPPDEILAALTGVRLAPDDLQAILTGCVDPMPRATAGRLHGNGWASIDLASGAVVYLQQQSGVWRVRAARRDGWQIEYVTGPGQFPQSVRLQSTAADLAVDLTTEIAQVATNEDLSPEAFRVEAPADARPLSLDELRQSGPLREQP
jgi:hypothetical protein